MNLNKLEYNLLAFMIIVFSSILHFSQCLLEPAFVWDEFLYSTRAFAFIRLFSNPIPLDVIYSDHPPLGWIILGLGSMFFPSEIIWTSRVRLVISAFFTLNALLLYLIASKYHSKVSGIITLLLYGLQVGFLEQSRQIYVDNIGIFFVLWAYYHYISPKSEQYINKSSSKQSSILSESGISIHLSHTQFNSGIFYFSGILMGLAICVKLPFIFFIPGFIIVYYCRNGDIKLLEWTLFSYNVKKNLQWIGCTIIPLLIYLVVCLILNRFDDVLNGSLAKLFQRASEANFIHFTYFWMILYPVFFVVLLVLLGFFLIVFVMYLKLVLKKFRHIDNTHILPLFSPKNHQMHDFLLHNFELWGFAFGYFLFLVRGGTINSHYMIPLFSFGSLFISVFLVSAYHFAMSFTNELHKDSPSYHQAYSVSSIQLKKPLILCLSVSLIIVMLYPSVPLEFKKSTYSTSYQYRALDWVQGNIPRNCTILIHTFFAAELYEAGYRNVQVSGFYDPSDLDNDWRQIDYIITNSLNDINGTFTASAIQNSVLLMQFEYYENQINIYQVNKPII